MAATKRKTATTKRATARVKPKTGKSATSKAVKRSTATKPSAVRKTTAKKAAPKATAKVATASAKTTQSDAIMKMGTDAIRQMMEQTNNSQMQENLQQQMMNMSQESAAQLAKSADTASKSMEEMMELSKENVDAAVACSSIAVNASKSMGAELFNYANKSFSQNVEMSKEIFGCRTINDMFDLQSKVVKTNLDHFFNESVKMSEMVFQCANEVSEPINERVSANADRLSKVVSEAA